MAAKGVDRSDPLADQELASPMQDEHRLLHFRLDWDKARARSGHRLADRLGIGSIVLVPLHVRLDVMRRHQADVMAEGPELAGPVVGRPACLHADEAGRQLSEEANDLEPPHSLRRTTVRPS